ncbi:cell division protein FtsL [Salinivibrio sp. ES.052]|uniref:cell division protein FtsL n=1 Tax=Salinivibrio sp. ES.052 TaxID=1882823 RepID=UPI00092C2CE2|nr:cell division protein FtsL [Salinivibrio sp. ES.052]SIO06066.1 cell division protein FtsL [Salinivibrio sp. ES.052]
MKPRPSLAKQIRQDLLAIGKLPLGLLVAVLVSAIAVVSMTQSTRNLIAKQDTLLDQRETLEVEWRNQLLEENSLSEHSHVESVARESFGMIRPTNDNEVIVKRSLSKDR